MSVSNIRVIESGQTVEPGIFTVIALAVELNLDLGDMMRTRTGPIHTRAIIEDTVEPDR